MIGTRLRNVLLPGILTGLVACGAGEAPEAPLAEPLAESIGEYYGTLEPFASEAIYFLLTDRFVDGDPSNNQEDQGLPDRGTFDRVIQFDGEPPGNIGYLGGDFQGVLDNAAYIADMGYTSVWLTPIVDNPDEAFTGNADGNDNGKTGYHGYWGVNFFELDEHLPSPGLDYAELTRALRDDHGLKTILDVVCNHGSPSFTMPEDQPKFGEIYAADGTLLADHMNLHPSELDDANPLHDFFRRETDIGELSDLDFDNPAVLEHCVAATEQWLDQGAAAIRIDTIKHMPHYFWKAYSDRLRADRPGLFMFGEAFTYAPEELAEFTWPENGGNSVLDFAGREAMLAVFGATDAPYSDVLGYLHTDTGLYQNAYDLMTFYDNHDMTRIDANPEGFIDATNWLFTSRGIPVVYYGSEIGFRAGRGEHRGNRDYFGQENVDAALSNPIHAAMTRVAQLRKRTVALQRGLQANIAFTDDTATFLRVYQKDDTTETALVLLNKGDEPADMQVSKWLSVGRWRDAFGGEVYEVSSDAPTLDLTVDAHGVRVLLFDAPVNDPELVAELDRLQTARLRQQ